MKWAMNRRWWLYAVAALLTVAAMRWVDTRDDAAAVVQPAARQSPAGPAAERSTAIDALQRRTANSPLGDPFEVLSTPSNVSAKATVALAPSDLDAAAAAAPRLPPPMPFSFLGRWTEQGRTTVFLQRNDKSIAVHAPGRLDDEYSVQSIEEQGLVLKYLPLGQLQALRFDAPRNNPGPAVPAAPVAAAESRDDPNEN